MTVEPQPLADSTEALHTLLNRPAEQRAREFKYRFAQSIVFGLPVVALQRYGPALGGPEAGRWSGVLQLLLAGWVMYVAAAGMLFEGIVTLGRRISFDLLIALAAVSLYFFGAYCVARTLLVGAGSNRLLFDVAVITMATWSGIRWWQLSTRAGT